MILVYRILVVSNHYKEKTYNTTFLKYLISKKREIVKKYIGIKYIMNNTKSVAKERYATIIISRYYENRNRNKMREMSMLMKETH